MQSCDTGNSLTILVQFRNQTGCGDKSASDCDALQYHNGNKL